MVMVTIKRWGNSLAVVLPKEYVDSQGLSEGDEVELAVAPPRSAKEFYGLLPDLPPADELLKGIEDEWE